MSSAATKALVRPFESTEINLHEGEKGIFLNASVLEQGLINWADILQCEQGFRSDFLDLQNRGYEAHPVVRSGNYDFALVHLSRHKRLNHLHVNRAIALVKNGGVIAVAGEKTSGIMPLKKQISKSVAITGSTAKFHSVVFWFANQSNELFPSESGKTGVAGFVTAPGMFSHDKVDPGSELLIQSIIGQISGNVADLGAGWGYLSAQCAINGGKINHLDLYEADYRALEAARQNLSNLSPATKTEFHWRDVILEPITRKYDCIIMNPPFHTGRAADPQLGQSFVGAARHAIRPGGKLFLVANRHLPYEAVISRNFRKSETLAENAGYKVIKATA